MNEMVLKQNKLFEKWMIDKGRADEIKKRHPQLSAVKGMVYCSFGTELVWMSWLQSWRVNEAMAVRAALDKLPPLEPLEG